MLGLGLLSVVVAVVVVVALVVVAVGTCLARRFVALAKAFASAILASFWPFCQPGLGDHDNWSMVNKGLGLFVFIFKMNPVN